MIDETVESSIESLGLQKPKFTVRETFTNLMPLASILHLFFSLIFSLRGATELINYNFASAIFYLFIYFLIVKKFFTTAVFIVFAEIIVHSLFCDYFLDWEYGFFLYAVCAIPVVYYASVQFSDKLLLGNICSIITFIVVVFMKINSYNRVGEFEIIFASMKLWLYIINLVSAGFILNILLVAYIYEMKFAQEILKKRNEILNYTANIDHLTKLLNRRSMKLELKKAVSEFKETKEKFAILIGDIDNFKSFNDNYGHDIGDLILVAVADVLKQCSKEYEGLIPSRWGGEEFLVIIKNTSFEEAKKIGEDILNKVRVCNIPYNQAPLCLTMTLGGSIYEKENCNFEDVIKEADINLYSGKSGTKNCLIM